MFKGINQKTLILAIILGLVTSGVVFLQVTKKSQAGTDKGLVDVVVATIDINPRQIINEEMIEIKKMPAQFTHPLAYSEAKELLGKVAKEKILAGEAILENRILKNKDSSRLSAMIPPGKRAVTVAVNAVSGVAGMLHPGDFVDLLATFDANTAGEDLTTLFLQNIEILAVAQETESKGGSKESDKAKGGKQDTTITFLVTPWEAEQLTLAGEKGVIRLALRPFQPDDDVFATNVVLSDLTRLPRNLKNLNQPFPPSPLPPENYYPVAPPPVYQVEPAGKQEQLNLGGTQIEVIKGSQKEWVQVQ